MVMAVVDASAIRNFMQQEEAFSALVNKLFNPADLDGDGLLSKAELRSVLEGLHLRETSCGAPVKMSSDELDALYDSVFQLFDADHDGFVSRSEFWDQLRAIYEAMARSLGSVAVKLVTDENGLLQPVVNLMDSSAHCNSAI